MTTSLQQAVPVFKLYGETHPWPTPDLLHCELIRDRSGPNDWYIPPHRHADLMHVLYVRQGHGILHLEGKDHPIEGPSVLVVPAMTIHGFAFERDTDGYSVTLSSPLVSDLEERLGAQSQTFLLADQYFLIGQPEAGLIESLVTQLHYEYRYPAQGRESMLCATMLALAVTVARRAERRRTHQHPHRYKGHTHVIRYQRLIEEHYQKQPSISWLADQIGITASYLNTMCKQLAGVGAQQLLHDRLILEAKRRLTYTQMTISQVSDQLGFSEPAYFTRFFKRHTGLSPRDFRQRDG